MYKRFALASLSSLTLLVGASWAKPPVGAPAPKVNGEVPPTSVTDFFQNGITPAATELPPIPQPSPRRNLPVVSIQVDTLRNLESLKQASQYLELGDVLKSAGETALAAKAYEEAAKLAPGSRFSEKAVQQLANMRVRRDAAEAESEESTGTPVQFRIGPFSIEIGTRHLGIGLSFPPK